MEVFHVKRVGYWLTEKRFKRLKFETFEAMCRVSNVELVKLNFDEPLEEQGPFAVILHKISDLLAATFSDSVLAGKHIRMLQNYALSHPEVKMIDSVDNVLRLLDRHRQYQLVQECDIIGHGSPYFIPSFVEFTSSNVDENKRLMSEHGIEYPFVCKPSASHCRGDQRTPPEHEREEMLIIFNDAGLGMVDPPCIAQSFINHNARLFKVFIVGSHSYVIRRPSIKNIYAGDHETIRFDSNDISKSYSSSPLNKMDEAEIEYPIMEPNDEKMFKLVSVMQNKFEVNLLGIDVIIENKTGRYAVIDINPFPGYDGVEDFFPALLELIQLKLCDNDTVLTPPPCHQLDEHLLTQVNVTGDEVALVANETSLSASIGQVSCKQCCGLIERPQSNCRHFSDFFKSKPSSLGQSCRRQEHRLSDGTNKIDKFSVVAKCVAR